MGGLASKAASPFTGIADRLFNVSGGLAAVGGALTGAAIVGGLRSMVAGSLEAIDATSELAQSVGTTAGELATLRYQALRTGSDAESLDKGLAKMSATLGDAARAGGPAAATLRGLGLDAKQLAKLDAAEAFRQIAGGISQIPDASGRASAAMDLFGKSGLKLVNTLSAGPEALKEISDEAKAMGLALSGADVAKVDAANNALDRAGTAIGGIGNQITIGLAPYIEAAATKFVELAASGIDAGSFTSKAMDWIATGIGVVADVLHTVKLGWMAAKVGASGFVAAVLKGLATTVRGLEQLLNLIPGVEVAFSDDIGAAADGTFDQGVEQLKEFNEALLVEPPSTGIKQFFGDIKTSAEAAAKAIADAADKTSGFDAASAEMAGKVSDLTTKLQGQVATFGLSGEQLEIHKLKQEGATDAMLAGANAAAARLRLAQAQQKEERERLKGWPRRSRTRPSRPSTSSRPRSRTSASSSPGG